MLLKTLMLLTQGKSKAFNPFWDASQTQIPSNNYTPFSFQSLLGCFRIWFDDFETIRFAVDRGIAFNPFWDASMMVWTPHLMIRTLSIPFGMLLDYFEGKGLTVLEFFQSLLGCFMNTLLFSGMQYIHFQSLLGCFHTKKMRSFANCFTFNPFWDASKEYEYDAKIRLYFQSLLGCFLNSGGSSVGGSTAFNPFWDASMYLDLPNSILLLYFQSLLGCFGLLLWKGVLEDTPFNPFWDASNNFYDLIVIAIVLFQSLLGCFRCVY